MLAHTNSGKEATARTWHDNIIIISSIIIIIIISIIIIIIIISNTHDNNNDDNNNNEHHDTYNNSNDKRPSPGRSHLPSSPRLSPPTPAEQPHFTLASDNYYYDWIALI